MFRLLVEAAHPVLGVHRHDAERLGVRQLDLDATDRHVGILSNVVGHHGPIVHLVDVVPGKHQDVVRFVVTDDVLVLIDGVGGTRIPGRFVDPLLGRPQLDEFPEFRAQDAPALLDVQDEGMGLVLGNHADPADTRVDAVG